MRWCCYLLVIAVCAMSLSIAVADVKPHALICSNMMLQQEQPLKIWGTADPQEKVTVSFCGQTADTIADGQGKWLVALQPVKAGGPFEMSIAGKNALKLENILVGEVWVCSGQSNMQFGLAGAKNAAEEIAAANYPQIRLFKVPNKTAQEPQTDVTGTWEVCTPQTAPGFTAVGYFFGRDLHKALGVPVGLIGSSWGGTTADAWTTVPSMQADPEYQAQLQAWEKRIADHPAAMEKFKAATEKWNADNEAWKKACETAKAEGKPLPPQPARPRAPEGADGPNRPGNLYNGMISPLVNYAIKGAIWYQGESNAGRAYQYRKLLPLMISDWRKAWGYDFAFHIAQLANFMARKDQPGESAWAELREAQTMTGDMPGNGQAVIIDVGDAADIHPKDKQTVGYRLSLAARAKTYGEDLPYAGPTYLGMVREGNTIRLHMDHTDGGMVARDSRYARGFAIAGADKKFYWGRAKIEGDDILVYSRHVKDPVAVRYAWADNPEVNLYNGAGLPAVPFRTDDWPGVTVNNH